MESGSGHVELIPKLMMKNNIIQNHNLLYVANRALVRILPMHKVLLCKMSQRCIN